MALRLCLQLERPGGAGPLPPTEWRFLFLGTVPTVRSINRPQRSLTCGPCRRSWWSTSNGSPTVDTGGISWTRWWNSQSGGSLGCRVNKKLKEWQGIWALTGWGFGQQRRRRVRTCVAGLWELMLRLISPRHQPTFGEDSSRSAPLGMG